MIGKITHLQKITPNLWYDTEAGEAAKVYTSIFSDAAVMNSVIVHDTPSGDAQMLTVRLLGQEFTLLNAGPLFKFNPSISFLVACSSLEEVNELWEGLTQGGEPLMELGEYPFSARYGWTQDRYGLSWQLMFTGDRDFRQRIIPTMMFTGDVCGRAEEAIGFYVSVFEDAKAGDIMRYGKGEQPDEAGTVKHADFMLAGEHFAAMDSARMHDFSFNEAISFVVHCDSQEEVDRYWDSLSAEPAAEQCGWLKDRYGVSWQIVPAALEAMLADDDAARVARVTKAFLKMKKLDIAKLKEAYEG